MQVNQDDKKSERDRGRKRSREKENIKFSYIKLRKGKSKKNAITKISRTSQIIIIIL